MTEKLEKINRKAVKLGIEPLTITAENETSQPIVEDDKIVGYHVYQDVTLIGEDPIIGGWLYIAKLETIDGKANLVLCDPEISIPSFYHNRNICDHCNQTRNRTVTFLLQSETTQEYKQVGKMCLKDFLGHSPEKILAFVALFDDISLYLSELESKESDNQNIEFFDSITYLSYVHQNIKRNGWTSSAKEREEGGSATFRAAYHDMQNKREIQKESEEIAKEALLWARGLETENDFLLNIKRIAETDRVQRKFLSTIASIFVAKKMEDARVEREKARAKINANASKFIGEIGQKINVEVEFCNTFTYQSNYGTVSIHAFATKEGNVVIWKTTTNQKFENGFFMLEGKIKEHSVYDDTKQTILTRCKIQ